MAESYKTGRLITTIQEFENTGDKYLINGIDVDNAIFFARKRQELFELIPKGNYTIREEGGSKYLVITNAEYLADIEKIQVGIEFSSISSEYVVDFNVDVNILKDRYNEVVEDVKNLFKYIKKTNMLADGQDTSIVLPTIKESEVWVRTADGYKGVSLTDAEGIIKDNITKYTEEMKRVLDQYVEDPLKIRLDEYEKEKEVEIQDLIKRISDNIAQQVFEYKLPIGQNTIDLPLEWVMSDRLTIHINGLLLTKGDDYGVSGKRITLTQTYEQIADVYVEDMLPTTYTEQLREELIQLIENAKDDIQTSTNQNLVQISNKGNEQITLILQQGEKSKQVVINQETISVKVLQAQEEQSKQNIQDYVTNTSFPEIDKYIEDNKANLKGDKGDTGEKGEKGDTGEKGADGVVTEVKGFIGFQIRNGDLYVKYTGDEVPNFSINSNGELIYTI